jgi:hypothetical protein
MTKRPFAWSVLFINSAVGQFGSLFIRAVERSGVTNYKMLELSLTALENKFLPDNIKEPIVDIGSFHPSFDLDGVRSWVVDRLLFLFISHDHLSFSFSLSHSLPGLLFPPLCTFS